MVITLVFGVLFIILTVVLLLSYISRLIAIALGAVLSPLVLMLWAMPHAADFSKIAVKRYLSTIFSVFIHVVVIQLAASILTLPGKSKETGIMAVLVGIGLMFTLIKTQLVSKAKFFKLIIGIKKTGKNLVPPTGQYAH
jgi:hypothetical protein